MSGNSHSLILTRYRLLCGQKLKKSIIHAYILTNKKDYTTMTKKTKLSRISVMHYIKLVLRSVLFLTATLIYVLNRIFETGKSFGGLQSNPWVLGIIWLIFVVEMILRFFPQRLRVWAVRNSSKRIISPGKPVKSQKTNHGK